MTLRGKKYTIPEDVHTVPELRAALSLASGVVRTDLDKQSVLFQGTRLEPDAVLKDAGVTDGAALSMVPASGAAAGGGSGKRKKKAASSPSGSATSSAAAAISASGEASPSGGGMDAMLKEYMKNAGVDPAQLDDMMKSMGGGAGGSLQEAMTAMSGLMQSPMFKEYMSDPEKLEQSRQMILNNPMLKGMMAGMPGMEELLNDKDAWKEAMMAAASIYETMDKNDLMKGIMSGLSGQPPPTGLFDGAALDAASSKAAAALEELEEDD